MTPAARRAALLDFVRARLPDGASISSRLESEGFFDIRLHRGRTTIRVHPDATSDEDPPVLMHRYEITASTPAEMRAAAEKLLAAVTLAESIEAFARGLPTEDHKEIR